MRDVKALGVQRPGALHQRQRLPVRLQQAFVGRDQRDQVRTGRVSQQRHPAGVAAIGSDIVGDPTDGARHVLGVHRMHHALRVARRRRRREPVVDAHQQIAGAVKERALVLDLVALVADGPAAAVDPDHHRREGAAIGPGRRGDVEAEQLRRHSRDGVIRDILVEGGGPRPAGRTVAELGVGRGAGLGARQGVGGQSTSLDAGVARPLARAGAGKRRHAGQQSGQARSRWMAHAYQYSGAASECRVERW